VGGGGLGVGAKVGPFGFGVGLEDGVAKTALQLPFHI
jgi:hypothetical protein